MRLQCQAEEQRPGGAGRGTYDEPSLQSSSGQVTFGKEPNLTTIPRIPYSLFPLGVFLILCLVPNLSFG